MIGTRNITIGPHIGIGIGGASIGSFVDLTGKSFGLLIGQSNQNGAGTAARSALIPGLAAPFPAVYLVEKLQSNSSDPITWDESGPAGRGPVALSPRTLIVLGDSGPQLSMGRELDHTQPGVWVLGTLAVGGTTIVQHWKTPGGTYPTALPRLADQIVPFATSIIARGATLKVVDLSLGTSDALVSTSAANFTAGLQNLYNLVRTSFPTVPWVVHLICSTSGGGGGGAADVTAIRTGASTFASNANGVSAGSVTVIDDDDALYMPGPGQIHYPTDGYVRVGRRATSAWFTAIGVQQAPTADFRYFSNGLSTTFTDLTRPGAGAGSGTLTAWDWDFGDGSAHGTTQNPTRVYAAPGTYSVVLVVTDANGKTDTITHATIVIASITWPVDATSGKGCPVTAADWTAVLAAAGVASGNPANARGWQEAAAPIVDQIASGGVVNMGINNAPTMQAAITGWTRLGVVWTATNQKASNSTTAPNPNARRVLKLAYLLTPAAAPGTDRDLFGFGGGTAGGVRISTISHLKMITSATVSAFEVWTGATVKPTLLRIDPIGGTTTLFTEAEKYIVPFQVVTSAVNEYFGTFNLTAVPGMGVLLDATFTDAAANMTDDNIRDVLRVLGWNPTYGVR